MFHSQHRLECDSTGLKSNTGEVVVKGPEAKGYHQLRREFEECGIDTLFQDFLLGIHNLTIQVGNKA